MSDNESGIVWPVNIRAMVPSLPEQIVQDSEQKNKEKKKRRRRYGSIFYLCLLCLILLLLLCLLIPLFLIHPYYTLLISIHSNTTIITPTMMNTTTTKPSTTITTETTTAATTTTPTTTSITKTTPTTTTTTTSTNITTTTADTTMTSAPSTTATVSYCGQSCLNQSWIDPSGVIALWPFDGTFLDNTNVYNGTTSANPPTFGIGYFDEAAVFNASAKQAIYTPFIPLNNASFTVEAWIKPTGYPNPTDHSIVGLCPSKTTDHCLHINIRNAKLYFGFYFNDIQGGTTIALNKWIYTAFVFDVSTMIQTIYLNGFQDGQHTATSVLLVKSGNFTIGTNEGVVTPNNYFQGYIDELSINQRPKSSCEILERATLAAYFKFDTTPPYIDSGPNSVATSYSGTSTTTGYRNQAISFTGSSSEYFQASGFTSFGITNQSFSITLWIKPQILSGTLVHLSTSSSGTGSTCFPLLGFTSDGAIVAQVLTINNSIVTATGPILPISSSWIPIVQTWSSTNGLKLYVNNTLVSSVVASSFDGSGITSNYVTLGNCLSGCSNCSSGLVGVPGAFNGAIDDWGIYNRELTSSDVCAMYFAS